MKNQIEREEEDLFRQYEDGEIDNTELTKELNELYRSFRAAAREAAERAYDDEMERW